jgi:hypothetical protein
MSLTWAIVARSTVPLVGHPMLKVGHSTSQNVQSFVGYIRTPWSPEKPFLKLASMVWSTIGCFEPEEPILYVPGDYQCHRTKGGGCLSVRGHTGAYLAATLGNGVGCGLAIVGSARQGDLRSDASLIHHRPYTNHHEVTNRAHSDSVALRGP